jgi:O-6-methylguanine DNA methyltransferase
VAYEVEGWGRGALWLEDDRVVWHELPRELPSPEPAVSGRSPGDDGRVRDGSAGRSQAPTHPRGGKNVPPLGARARVDSVPKVVRLLRRYFRGEAVALEEIPVDLQYETEFQTRCAHALRGIPRGEVVTYGELAALAAAPGAARAAGSFCARNRLGLFVPCHRVVSAGGLGSYGSLGLEYKRRLLELECSAAL